MDEAWPVDSSIDFDSGQRYCRVEHEGIVGGCVILFSMDLQYAIGYLKKGVIN